MMEKVMLRPILNQAPSAHFVKPSTAKEEKKYYALLFFGSIYFWSICLLVMESLGVFSEYL